MTHEEKFRPLAVQRVTDEAADVVSLTLASPDGAPLPAWEPGAHVDVMLGDASGADAMVRQYSLCSSPTDASWRIAVLREDGGTGSTWVHEHVRVGDTLRVATTRNTFPFDPADAPGERHVFVAGGIGVTPLLAMVEAADAAGLDWALLYLVSSRERAAFADELVALGPRVRIHDRAVAGSVHLADALDELGAGDARLYACGPARMLAAVEDYATGRPGCALVLERFATGAPAAPGEAAAAVDAAQTGRAFVVETADGTEVDGGADETILAALRRCGFAALSSCEEGICGTCETPVISGVPDHRDQLLSDEEREANDTMMICVSRCLGDRLVLDLWWLVSTAVSTAVSTLRSPTPGRRSRASGATPAPAATAAPPGRTPTPRSAGGSPSRSGAAAWRTSRTTTATCGPGGASPAPARWSRAATSTACRTAGRSTARSGSSRRPSPSTSCARAGWRPGVRSRWSASATRRAPASGWRASAASCSPARWTRTAPGACATATG